MSAETSPDVVAALLRAGVRGYLAKGRLGPDLPDLVARCAAGEVILAVPTAAQALRRLADGASPPAPLVARVSRVAGSGSQSRTVVPAPRSASTSSGAARDGRPVAHVGEAQVARAGHRRRGVEARRPSSTTETSTPPSRSGPRSTYPVAAACLRTLTIASLAIR